MDNGASSYRRFRENGDVTGFDEIVMEYSDGLMLYLTSIVGNIWTAEELTEETFFLLGTKKPKFKEKCSFKTWLYTIGRNIAFNYVKKTARQSTVPIENAPELISDEAENLLSGMTAEERYEQRLAKVKPLLDAFFAWLETLQVSGKSALAKAVAYALNEKPYLYTFLENGNVPIDNNRVENAIRPFAVGRKNWMHSNTANGAKASAALYSIVATAQANGLNTEKYLTELFSQLAGTILLPFNT